MVLPNTWEVELIPHNKMLYNLTVNFLNAMFRLVIGFQNIQVWSVCVTKLNKFCFSGLILIVVLQSIAIAR
jgi:hypothetical protein